LDERDVIATFFVHLSHEERCVVLHSSPDRWIWERLIRRLGGVKEVARLLGCSEMAVQRWRSGDRNCTEQKLDRLIELWEARGEHERILAELKHWKQVAHERREKNRQKRRQRFFEKFGHWPDDPAWQRYKHRAKLPGPGEQPPESVTVLTPGQSGIPRPPGRLEF
jgi:hypothetical protein